MIRRRKPGYSQIQKVIQLRPDRLKNPMETCVTAELTFGAWLRLRRRQLDLTQKELADRSSCSVVTIRKIEQGVRRPSKQLAELMAAALQVPTEQVADFVTYARQDPDSTQVPPALQNLSRPSTLPVAATEEAHVTLPRPAATTVTYTLPRSITPFLGREPEIDALLGYLVDPNLQLVSVLGPGGMGKTRLALAVADRLVASDDNPFVDGIVFVSLAALTEPTQIAPAIADALAILIDTKRETKQQLLTYLSQKRLLLIIDNCEHLLDGIDPLMEIVQAAPNVCVLATSRERLHLPGEQAFPIDGLGGFDQILADTDEAMAHPAVRLFCQSAQRAAPTFVLTSADLPQMARICRLTAGMPLGIELSAGWVGMMSLYEIADEIQRNLDFLESNLRTMPARHRSMRAVFDASWQHLDPAEERVFRQLSIFRGGFTRQAAAGVANASLRHLGHLMYKSLLHYDRAHNRYWLHELLHQYGAEKLAEDAGEASATAARHRSHYLAMLAAQTDSLKGQDQQTALAAIDIDIDNIRLAWRTAVAENEVAELHGALDALGFYHEWSVHPEAGREAFQLLAETIDAAESSEARQTLVRALAWQASFLRQMGNPDVAIECLEQAMALCDHPALGESARQVEHAFIYYQWGYCLERRQNERALDYFRKSVALWQAHDDPWWTALALGGLGFNLSWSNRFVEAREQLSKSVEIFERYGHTKELVVLHVRLCDSCKFKGDLDAALYHGQRALVLAEESGNRKSLADALAMLSTVTLIAENRLEAAEALNREALAIYRSLGVGIETALAVAGRGSHRLIRGDIGVAEQCFLEAMGHFQDQQLRQGEGFILRWLAIIAYVNGHRLVASEKISHSIKIFDEVGANNYIPHLRSIRYLIEKATQPPAQALLCQAEILRHALEIRELYDVYWSLSAIAYALMDTDYTTHDLPLPPPVALAAEIRGFLSQSLEFGQSAYLRALVHDEVDSRLTQWPQKAITAALDHGRQQELWTFVAAVLDCLDADKVDQQL